MIAMKKVEFKKDHQNSISPNKASETSLGYIENDVPYTKVFVLLIQPFSFVKIIFM